MVHFRKMKSKYWIQFRLDSIYMKMKKLITNHLIINPPQTFHFLLNRPDDNEHGMQLDERNRPELESIPNEYIAHMYGKVDRSALEFHLKKYQLLIIQCVQCEKMTNPQRNHYHPTIHDNVKGDLCPVYQHANINRNQIL